MLHSILRSAFGIAAAVATLAAMPAQANSSAATDFTTAARAAASASPIALGSGDEQFSQLFASLQALDGPTAARPASSVSIPSRVPLDGFRLSSSYGMRDHPVTGGRRAHNGLDMASPTGTPIRAAADGIVGKADWFGAYGLYVALDHGGAMETRYAHMSRINVSAGQRVRKGEVIGFVGSTGRSTGPHLHYEVRVAGRPVDPTPYLQSHDNPTSYAAAAAGNGRGGPE